MSETVTIDFERRGYEGKVFSGRQRGVLARQEFSIDELDTKNITVKVIVPPRLFSLTSSFFLGMFGPTLRSLGTKEAFKSKYQIDAPATILEEIDEYIDMELRRAQFPN